MMSYYVFYNYGSCNEGDCACGLERFASFEEAAARRDEIVKREYEPDVKIIHGEEVDE
jgi:hypothetical protein